MEFFELIKKRKSIRSFRKESVSAEILKKILEAATYAPSNCNQQLWNFIVIDDSEIKERLIKEAASNTLLRRAPVLIVLTYDGWNAKEAIQGASLALSHIVLAATELGVGSLPMNSYGADSQVKRILKIPENEKICCFVALGYPDEKAEAAPVVPRRPVEESLHYNFFARQVTPPFVYDPNAWSIEEIQAHQRYYCRKTFLGKEMDIMSEKERELVRKVMEFAQAPLVDFFSYDGAYIREFPKVSTTFVDLTPETSEYTKAACESVAYTEQANFVTFDTFLSKKAKTVSIIYKLERIPDSFKQELFKKAHEVLEMDGELVIIARKSNVLLSFFFFFIKIVFGNELRKTGIYNFFGPYQPLSRTKTIQQLHTAGFTNISTQGYFPFPAFYEQVYQMFLQYRKSEGSSYLHREKRVTMISRLIATILKLQGMKRFGLLGSVIVIRCQK